MSKRIVTLFTGQWADMSFDTVCETAFSMGYEGLEVCIWGKHIDVEKAYNDDSYCKEILDTLNKYNLKMEAIGSHLVGQVIGDVLDERHKNFLPQKYHNDLEAGRVWAIDIMMKTPTVAKKLNCHVVTGFLGSPIWNFWYSYPQTTQEVISKGYELIKSRWIPILDEFKKQEIKFAFEVHPAEIAYDYYTAKQLLEVLDNHEAFGFNFDPSHLVWQGIRPELFIRDFSDKIFHVHMKDVVVCLDGRAGILGSMLNFGDTRRGWNFVSIGHGDVDFDKIIRELNSIGYTGPLSIEWEDSGMDRLFGAKESFEYIAKINFDKSSIAFDDAQKQ